MSSSKIIGGEFSISPLVKNQNHIHTISYSSGRSALASIVESFGKLESPFLVPDYLCESITRTLKDINVNYDFYHIGLNLEPDFPKLENQIKESKVILIINYFGCLNIENIISNIRKINSNITVILDNVQAYYNMKDSTDADYTFTSYRKWFPLPDGAEVKSKNNKVLPLYTGENTFYKSKLSGNMLKSISNVDLDNIALKLIEDGENLLDNNYKCVCSEYSQNAFTLLNHKKIIKRRKANAKYIHQQLELLNINHLYNPNSVQLFVPIFIENRNELRKAMFKNNIFTPIHWPYISEELNGYNKNILYENELSLICDQRYNIKDMEKQIRVVKSCL